MTAGQDAMREAARLEAALVYGGVRADTGEPISPLAAQAEAVLSFRERLLDEGVRFGMSNSEVMQAYGATYREVRAARTRAGQDN